VRPFEKSISTYFNRLHSSGVWVVVAAVEKALLS
jgi:hypothetical protein